MTLRTQTLLQLRFDKHNLNHSRRDRAQILAEILLLCNNQKRKSNIRSKADLSYKELLKHLDYLTQLDMLERNKHYYVTTKKGNEFLEGYVYLKKLLYYDDKGRSLIRNLE